MERDAGLFGRAWHRPAGATGCTLELQQSPLVNPSLPALQDPPQRHWPQGNVTRGETSKER